MANYYYARGNQRFGPVSAERLKQLAASGGLRPEDLVCQEGGAKWHEAKSVKALFPSASAGTPPHGKQVLPVAQVSEGTAAPTPLPAEVVNDSDAGVGATYIPCPHCNSYLAFAPTMTRARCSMPALWRNGSNANSRFDGRCIKREEPIGGS